MVSIARCMTFDIGILLICAIQLYNDHQLNGLILDVPKAVTSMARLNSPSPLSNTISMDHLMVTQALTAR